MAKDGRTLAARPLSDTSAVAVSSIAQMLSFPQVRAHPRVMSSIPTFSDTAQAPFKFRCQAQVVAMAPEDTCHVTRLQPGCVSLSSSLAGEARCPVFLTWPPLPILRVFSGFPDKWELVPVFIFTPPSGRFRLNLGRAPVWGRRGKRQRGHLFVCPCRRDSRNPRLSPQERFLNDFPADDFVKNKESCRIVTKKLARLHAPSAWIDCCLLSYVTRNGEGAMQTCFRMFNTCLCNS